MTIGNRPRSRELVLTVRADIRNVATLLRFYQSKGLVITSKSQLINIALADLVAALVANGHTSSIEGVEEAFRLLDSAFDINANAETKRRIASSLHIDTTKESDLRVALAKPADSELDVRAAQILNHLNAVEKVED